MLKKSTWWRMRLWIACCAILLNALAPSVSHALNAARGYVPVAEICSANASYGAIDQAWHLLADCDYCAQHAGDLYTPPAAGTPGLIDGHGRAPFLFHLAPRPLLALAAAHPRGPPADSPFALI